MIFDGLNFLGESLFGPSVSVDAVVARMDEVGIHRSVLCAFKPRDYRLEGGNERVADAVAANADRFVGFVRVDPHLGAREAERGLHELDLRGIFLHPWEETFRINAQVVDDVLEVAATNAAPVLVASGYPWLSEAPQISEIAQRFPNVTFIATNGGQINMSGLGQVDAELALASSQNLIIQTAGVYREDFLEQVVKNFGSERLMFASSFPLLDSALEIRRVTWAHFEPADAELILGLNLRRLLNSA
jgi:predicted TIM-barrel fold metal-dependent hydrolase